MEYTSPEQMRTVLAELVPNNAFLDRMIAEHFKNHKPAPLPKQAPVAGHKQPTSYKAPAKCAIKREWDDYIDAMEKGSMALANAIEAYLHGRDPGTPDRLIWNRAYGADVGLGDSSRQIKRPCEVPRQADHSSPCFKCGAARGCVHRG